MHSKFSFASSAWEILFYQYQKDSESERVIIIIHTHNEIMGWTTRFNYRIQITMLLFIFKPLY